MLLMQFQFASRAVQLLTIDNMKPNAFFGHISSPRRLFMKIKAGFGFAFVAWCKAGNIVEWLIVLSWN